MDANALFTVTAARAVAQAQADAGLLHFNALQKVAYESKVDPQPVHYNQQFSHAVPAVTCLAFSAELFLKVIYFQHHSSYPHGHDLLELFQSLPATSQLSLRQRYSIEYNKDHPFAVVHYALSGDPLAPAAVPAPALPSLDLALSHLRRSFEEWRYIYEVMKVSHAFGVNFRALIALIEAERLEVAEHKGNIRLRVVP